jgi:sulfite reductase alpha subunit-like flavoprotein
VKQLAARIGASLDEEFTLHADASVGTLESPFPCPTTVTHALTNYLDINGAVSKTLLRRLSQLAKDEDERAKLLQVHLVLLVSTGNAC